MPLGHSNYPDYCTRHNARPRPSSALNQRKPSEHGERSLFLDADLSLGIATG